MIVLDTNVISEMMKGKMDLSVKEWLNKQAKETLYLSTITQAELCFGIHALSDGKKKTRLLEDLEKAFKLFQGRILSFDEQAAEHYAHLAVIARKKGKGFPIPDGYIAAIASSNGFYVASRDTAPYEAANVKIINPWEV